MAIYFKVQRYNGTINLPKKVASFISLLLISFFKNWSKIVSGSMVSMSII